MKSVVTKLIPWWFLGTPKTILASGVTELTLQCKVRVYMVREIVDSDMGRYARPSWGEKEYESLVELYNYHPSLQDTPIYDLDNKLKQYKE